MIHSVHIPIMAEPILSAFKEGIEKIEGDVVLIDATFGGGGHTGIFLEQLPTRVKILSLDRDSGPITRGETQFKDDVASGRLHLVHTNFGDLTREKFPVAIRHLPFVAILADLGFSSDQLEDPERGISFQREGPLDMRLNRQEGATAWEVLNELSERELADVIYKYGEERMSRRISSLIKNGLRAKTLENSTTAFAALVERAFPPKLRHGRIHAAT
ncbi:MAG: 16S rRNA (cytosine(1402)-N(4))-methyltransferase, partial [Proteobacteria bacterium]